MFSFTIVARNQVPFSRRSKICPVAEHKLSCFSPIKKLSDDNGENDCC